MQTRSRPVAASAVLILIGWVLALPASPAVGREQAGDVEKGTQLLVKGDALADQGKYDDAVLKYKEAFENLLPAMRRLPFKREVEGHFTPRKELKELIQNLVKEEVTPEEIRADELTLKALGLIPPEMDLEKTLVQMFTEEVAGFYDARKEVMHLIHEELAAPKPRKRPGLLERIFGAPEGPFKKDENKMVLAHELTHALADQHFELDALQKKVENDGDQELALMALVEGEAMLTMIGAASEDWDGTVTAQIPARQLAMTMNLMGSIAGLGSGPTFRQAPPVLKESMLFPYMKGVVFAAHLTNQGGWAALDKAYREPPLSTEQVLHPEKYLNRAKLDAPTAVELGDLQPGETWKHVMQEVVGELVIGIMLREHSGRTAAAGWDGDTVAVFETPEDKLGLVWVSTWDTDQDAREFARSYAAYQAKRFGLAGAAGAEEGEASDPSDELLDKAAPPAGFAAKGDDVLRRDKDGLTLHVQVRGPDVVVVEGFEAEVTDALVERALAAEKNEKPHGWSPIEAGAENEK